VALGAGNQGPIVGANPADVAERGRCEKLIAVPVISRVPGQASHGFSPACNLATTSVHLRAKNNGFLVAKQDQATQLEFLM
jgi:hypothetical protein